VSDIRQPGAGFAHIYMVVHPREGEPLEILTRVAKCDRDAAEKVAGTMAWRMLEHWKEADGG